jgi:hypothetical protein
MGLLRALYWLFAVWYAAILGILVVMTLSDNFTGV